MAVPDLSIEAYLKKRRAFLINAVRELRTSHGLTQQDIANLIGCSRTRITRMETENFGGYTQEELEIISIRLGQTPNDFLGLNADVRAARDIAYTRQVTSSAVGKLVPCEIPDGARIPSNRPEENFFDPQLTFSPDHALLAGFVLQKDAHDTPEAILCVWDSVTGRLLSAKATGMIPTSLAFGPDNKRVAYAGDRDRVWVYSWNEHRIEACLDPMERHGYPDELLRLVEEDETVGYGTIANLAWSSDGRLLAAHNEEHGTLRFWNTQDYQIMLSLSLNATWAADDDKLFPEVVSDHDFRQFIIESMKFVDGKNHLSLLIKGTVYELNPFMPEELVMPIWGIHEYQPYQIKTFETRAIECPSYKGELRLLAFAGQDGFVHLAAEMWGQYPYGVKQLFQQDQEPSLVEQLAIVDPHTVLGLVSWDTQDMGKIWTLRNFVTQQVIALSHIANPQCIRLSGNGQSLAIMNQTGIYVQRIQVEQLSPSSFSSNPFAEALDTLLRETSSEQQAPRRAPATDEDPLISRREPESIPERNRIEQIVNHWKEQHPQYEGGYGLAHLSSGDQETLPATLLAIQMETSEMPAMITCVEDPTTLRSLLFQFLGRSPQPGEPAREALQRLTRERPYSLILIDHAERLDHAAMRWICKNLRSFTDLFLLVTRDEGKFMQMIRSVRSDSEFLRACAFKVDFSEVTTME